MKENRNSKKLIFIVILLLILLIIALVIYKISTKSKEIVIDGNKNISIPEAVIYNENEKEEVTNQEESAIEIDINNDTVKTLIKKIDFKNYAVASIYKVKEFNLDTIPNELILRLAWASIDENDKKLVEDSEVYKQTATKETFDNSVKNIFGKNIKYYDATFTNIDVLKFNGYNENIGDITYADNVYIANYVEGGGAYLPFIYQYIDKAIKNGDEIKIYVKTAFIDVTAFDEAQYEFTYSIYKNFDNEKSEFTDKITDISVTDFNNKYITEGYRSISFNNNEELTNNLNSYVYTFKFDNSTERYYLSEFSNVK